MCDKCNAKKCRNSPEFKKFYQCEMCKDMCCINCMYLACSTCNKEFACFWCGTMFVHNNDNENNLTLKCRDCSE